MEFKVDEKIFEKYPELEIALLIVKNANNNDNEEELISEISIEIKNKIDPEKITEIPTVAKWREVYKSFGAKPQKYRNSAEALLKSVFTRGVPSINKLVDLYNYTSLKYTMTVGGEDTDKVEGNIELTFADGNEEFYSIGSSENDSPKEGEIAYKDDKGVICRRWNWREADRTKLTENTKNCVIVIENLLPAESEKLKQASEELKNLIEEKCKAEVNVYSLDKNSKEVEI